VADEPEGRAQRTDQVNLRLAPEELDVAQARAFLDDVSVARLLQGVVVDYLATQAKTPEVVEVRTARQRHRSRKARVLAQIPRSREGNREG
jgi:hypothetical protein